MSGVSQTNGKKSSNSSAVNTPASTPVTNGNSQSISQTTPPPPNNNAPKYGTLVPNRIFVGGISANTTEGELLQLFSTYGTVKAAKIIQDRAGVSKGYGFITFESEDDAKRPLKDADNIVLRERKLNIAPAIKKQPFNRAFDASSPSTVAPGNTAQYFFPPSAGVPYFQGGVTYYQQPQAAPGDPNSQPTTVYQAPPVYPAQTGPPQAPTYSPLMYPHHIYMPQQYAMPPMPYDYNFYPNNGGPQYMVGGQNGGPTGPSSISSAASGSSNQQGGGTPMSTSSSPPRPPPPCYNSQLPPYAPDTTLFYNMPAVYGGGALDAASGIYSETLDMANNGGYSEVSQILGDFLTGYDGMTEIYSAQDLGNHPHHYTEPTPPPPPQQPPPTQQISATDANDSDNSRQTKTPVVSLLSMEQQQEKDFVSMQGGRRVKLQPPPQPPPPQVLQQQLVMPPHHFHHQPPPMFYNFNGPPMRSQMPPPPPLYHKTGRENHMNNNWRSKSRNYNTYNNGNNSIRKMNENGRDSYSSRSSLRTDSNSSANDDNKELPPPAPAASLPPPSTFHMYNGTRTYQNSVGKRNNQHINNLNATAKKEDNNNAKNNKSNYQSSMQQVRSSNQQSFVMSASVNAARRNKRTTRRQQAGGSGLSEIGAGDAPLPNNDITETCKKLETLKM